MIVSTALNDDGEVVLRVRDTGIGMSESDIETALEPFRQIATTIAGRAGGTGLGLPLTKALAEANRARFQIKSTPKEGTLVEIVFRPRTCRWAESGAELRSLAPSLDTHDFATHAGTDTGSRCRLSALI